MGQMAGLVAVPVLANQGQMEEQEVLVTLQTLLHHKEIMAGLQQGVLVPTLLLVGVAALVQQVQTERLLRVVMGAMEQHLLFLARQ